MESGAGGGNAAVVSVGKMVQEDKEEMVVEIEKKLEKDEIGGCGGRQDPGEELEHSVLGGEKMEGNGVQENGKEGVSGSAGFEDTKVISRGKGSSLMVDVKGSLASENGSEVHEGSLADEHEGNGSGEPMEIDTKQEDGESDSKMGLQENGESDSKMALQEIGVKEKDQVDVGDDEKEEDHDFVAGDFVWAELERQQWWPGQIHDPSDASDHAAKLKRKGQLLVAYFGASGLFSWCSPSKLKPFVDNFREMVEHSNSKSFVDAVRKAVDEVGRAVEAELTCKCQAAGDLVESSGVVNSGIRPGAPVRKGNTVKVLMDGMKPIELLSTLDLAATMESTPSMLELRVVSSFMTAYSRKGSYLLPAYHEPKCIEGLDDKKSGIVWDSDTSGPAACGPRRRGRKKKSVVELLGEKMGVEYKRKEKMVDEYWGGAAGQRQRKKSKYLLPPYTSPMGKGKSGSEEQVVLTENASPSSITRSTSGKKLKAVQADERYCDGKEEVEININGGGLNVKDVVGEVLCAAVDASYLLEKKKDVTEFMSSFRSSVVEDQRRKQGEEDEEDDEVEYVKQKLEMLRSMVERGEEGKMNAETKAGLEAGMKELLEKVSKMG